MSLISRTLRTAVTALVLTAFAVAGSSWAVPAATLQAGSSGQPGEIDVGDATGTPTAYLLAGSSGQPGEIDVG
jgi:hypothetical protein